MITQGQIIKIISNQFTVLVNGKEVVCSARGKFRNDKISPVVGDKVKIAWENKQITEIMPRQNYFERPLVANVDVAVLVTSVKKPDLSLFLLDKLISNVLINKCVPIICFSKLDLLSGKEGKEIKKIQKYYQSIGIKVITNNDLRKIKKYLKNKVAFLTGQTGAGKSTLLNKLDKNLNLETKPISEALNRGVHTTRHVELFKVAHSYIVDTPGFSALDFKNVTINDLKMSFPEFAKYQCKFPDCSHHLEKDCGVRNAVLAGKIAKTRYENYLKFLGEVNENNRKLFKK